MLIRSYRRGMSRAAPAILSTSFVNRPILPTCVRTFDASARLIGLLPSSSSVPLGHDHAILARVFSFDSR